MTADPTTLDGWDERADKLEHDAFATLNSELVNGTIPSDAFFSRYRRTLEAQIIRKVVRSLRPAAAEPVEQPRVRWFETKFQYWKSVNGEISTQDKGRGNNQWRYTSVDLAGLDDDVRYGFAIEHGSDPTVQPCGRCGGGETGHTYNCPQTRAVASWKGNES